MSLLHIFAACVQLLSSNPVTSGDLFVSEEKKTAIEDLRTQWMHSLLQSILENRILLPVAHRIEEVPPLEMWHLEITPGLNAGESSFELLSNEIENLYCYGARKSEFDAARMHLQTKLLDRHDDLNPIYWSQLDSISFQEFSLFLATELELTEELDENEDIFISGKMPHIEFQQKLSKHSGSFNRPVILAQYADVAPGSSEADAVALFESLPINDQERKIIDYIITTMAEKNILKLGLMRKTMEKKGKRIHHVHPFRFLNFVFSYDHLKHSMHKIHKSGFKWDGFIDGFSKKMKEEARHNNLMRYVPGFARSLNVNEDSVRHYISKQDYEGLVRFLMHAT